MRGLELVMWSEGQWEALNWSCDLRANERAQQKYAWTSRLYDWPGPEGRVAENMRTDTSDLGWLFGITKHTESICPQPAAHHLEPLFFQESVCNKIYFGPNKIKLKFNLQLFQRQNYWKKEKRTCSTKEAPTVEVHKTLHKKNHLPTKSTDQRNIFSF